MGRALPQCRALLVFLAMAILGSLAFLSGSMTEARLQVRPSPFHPSPPSSPPPTPRPSPPQPSPGSPPPSPHLWQPPPQPPSPQSPSPPSPPSSPAPPPPPPSSENCTQFKDLSEGPYWIEENIDASDVRKNLSYGVPLNLTLKVTNSTLFRREGTCLPIEAARVDLWQCRYDGLYSDEADDGTTGETWLRGYQDTNSTGHVLFYTIFPGWYSGRTVHIHLRIRIYSSDGSTTLYDDTTQIFFDDTVTDAVFQNVYPYNSRGSKTRDTHNGNDPLFTSTNLISVTGNYSDADGYSSVVEMSFPFSNSVSLLPNGSAIKTEDGGSMGFASIL